MKDEVCTMRWEMCALNNSAPTGNDRVWISHLHPCEYVPDHAHGDPGTAIERGAPKMFAKE